LPELLQKLHDLYADDYPKFTAAFSEAVKSPTKTTYKRPLGLGGAAYRRNSSRHDVRQQAKATFARLRQELGKTPNT
jgi:hypothetical protein